VVALTSHSLAPIAAHLQLAPENLLWYGTDKAKVSLQALASPPRTGKLILVSAITPTPAGEGKTTVSIGLADGLKFIGQNPALALRQPSMGPVFGRKGGATGGGLSSLFPSDDINLHFTGDFHAITAAHNLLAAALDNQLHFRSSRLDPNRMSWKRVLDINDRALRRIRIGLESNGVERSSGFDITAASEIMACLCLASSFEDLAQRLNRIVVGLTPEGEPVLASEAKITGALLAVLRDAIKPNLVRSLEGVPAFVHGGPFANIAHGCNSILATRMAVAHADFAVTEAGFGFDLGGEKFLHIKCPQANLAPSAIVIVATARALKLHGGTALADLRNPNPASVEAGLPNLHAHLDAAAQFGRPLVVAINRFHADSDDEIQVIRESCRTRNVAFAESTAFADGGRGAAALAEQVVVAAATPSAPLQPLYSPDQSAVEKIRTIAQRIYGADDIHLTAHASEQLAEFERLGFGKLPVCMAKTQESLSDNPKLLGRPKGFTITVREFELANGAGFLVALTGKMVRMPALPKVPTAERFKPDGSGL